MPSDCGSRPWYSSCRLQASMVIVWSALVRISSPWLMSSVHVAPLFALPAKGAASVAACGVHVPSRLSAVNERKYRPSAPIASTIMRYWSWPATL